MSKGLFEASNALSEALQMTRILSKISSLKYEVDVAGWEEHLYDGRKKTDRKLALLEVGT
jgi:hypothetical protein